MNISLFQNDFFSNINFDNKIVALFDSIDRLCFFVKNRDFQIVYANPYLIEMYNLKEAKSIIGKTDHDILDTYLADKYRIDDIKVMETGKPVMNIIELVLSQSGIPDWFITNKIPVFSKNGEISGLMGTMKHVTASDMDDGNGNKSTFMYEVLSYIADNIEDRLTIRTMTDHFNMSERSFEKKFKSYLKMTPKNFIIKYRVLKASDYILKDGDIAGTAQKYGFYDQSAFTKQFKAHMHMTPLQYLKKYKKQ